MKTITIQIGNSDNKLTQEQWYHFVKHVRDWIEFYVSDELALVHFFGASAGYEKWQNAAWVVAMDEETLPALRQNLALVAKTYAQDSIALTVGETEFVSAPLKV